MKEEIIMAKQKKIKKHKREKPPRLTTANQVIYLGLFVIILFTGLAMIVIFPIVRHRFIPNEWILAIKDDMSAWLMVIPGFLNSGILFTKLYILYTDRYRFIQKIQKEKIHIKCKMFFIILIICNILITTICYFHRTELTIEGVQKYGFVNQLKVSYPKEDIVEVQIGIYQMIKSTTFAVNYKLIYKDGITIYFEQPDFRDIEALTKFDQSLSGVKKTVNDLDKIDKLKRNGNYSEEDWKRIMELFEITEN